jgi:hypothetical protein
MLIGNELFAQVSPPIISWNPYTAVPLDRVSTIIMAVLFVLIGAWLLHKSRKPMQQFLVAAVMVSGVYQYALDAVGAEPVPMSATGNKTLSCGAYYLLQNSEGGQLQVTGNSGATCVFQPAVGAPKLRNGFPNCDIPNYSNTFTLIMEKDTSCYLLTGNTGNV